MPYQFPPSLVRLKAFLGANGVRTNELEDALDVITVTNVLFSLAFEWGMDDAENETIMCVQQSVIAAIGYPNRRILGRQNLRHLPSDVISTAPGNRDKRTGKLRARDRKHLGKTAKAQGRGAAP